MRVHVLVKKNEVCCKAIVKPEMPVSLWVEDVNEECVLVDKPTICKQVVSLTKHFSESDRRMCTELRLFINNKINYKGLLNLTCILVV
jgi:hypothetical protein